MPFSLFSKIVAETIKAFKKLDVLFLNAGISINSNFEDFDDLEVFD